MTTAKPKRRRWMRLALLLLTLILLENIPGRYTLEDAQDEFGPDTWEGLTLMALSSVDLDASLYFETKTRHRISRNAELVVPAGATLTLDAWMEPKTVDGEVVARADHGVLRSNKPLTFIYRGVTVARARVLQTRKNDPLNRLEAVGQYRVISALVTSYRYHRQKAVRRDYQIPTSAKVELTSRIRPNHDIQIPDGPVLRTGAEPGRLRLTHVVYDRGQWLDGLLELSISLENPESVLQGELGGRIPNRIDLSDGIALDLRRLHDLRFRENRIDLRVDGQFDLSKAFQPDFTADLGFDLDLPQGVALNEAEVGIALGSVHKLDINRVNPLVDSMLSGLVSSRKDDLSARIHLGEEIPDLSEWPVFLHIRRFDLNGTPEGGPQVTLEVELR